MDRDIPSLNKDLLRSIRGACGRRRAYVRRELLEGVILGEGHPPKLAGCMECIMGRRHRAMGSARARQVEALGVLRRGVVVKEEGHVLRLARRGVNALCIPRVGRARCTGGSYVGVGRPEVGLECGVRQIVVWRGVGGGEEVCVERGRVRGGGRGGGAGVRGAVGGCSVCDPVVLVQIRAAKYVLGGHASAGHDGGVRRVRAGVGRRRRADGRRAVVLMCRGREEVERRGGGEHVHARVHRHGTDTLRLRENRRKSMKNGQRA